MSFFISSQAIAHLSCTFIFNCCTICSIYTEYTYKYITKGRICLLTLRSGFQPLGREILSWYSAGSQRVKSVLEEPLKVFTLGKSNIILNFSLSQSCRGVYHAQYEQKGMLAVQISTPILRSLIVIWITHRLSPLWPWLQSQLFQLHLCSNVVLKAKNIF